MTPDEWKAQKASDCHHCGGPGVLMARHRWAGHDGRFRQRERYKCFRCTVEAVSEETRKPYKVRPTWAVYGVKGTG